MTSTAPIVRPYRAAVIGIMTLGIAFGLATGGAALAGVDAIRTNGQAQVGSAGLVAGIVAGLVLGAFCSIVAVLGLWIGHRLERRARRPNGTRGDGGDLAAAG